MTDYPGIIQDKKVSAGGVLVTTPWAITNFVGTHLGLTGGTAPASAPTTGQLWPR